MVSYHAHFLDCETKDLPLYSEKYHGLRPKALRDCPEAFSSTYQSELALSEEQRLLRLQQKGRQVVIVTIQTGKANWLEEDWVGQVTLFGPMTKEEYFEPFTIDGLESSNNDDYTLTDREDTPDEADAYYHMTALAVDIDHRRRGIANLLCTKSFEIAAREVDVQVDMRIIVKPDNQAVLGLYSGLNFKLADQKSTLAEAIIASRETETLPKSFQSDKKYNTRGGIIMIRRLN